MIKTPSEARRRGRPKDLERELAAKQNLLDAANEMLKETSYKDISIRELARLANVNSAMISYHFGSKEGLFVDLIKTSINPESLFAAPSTASTHSASAGAPLAEDIIKALMSRFLEVHKKHPWLSRLIVDQVVLKEGKLRKLFVEKLVRPSGEQLLKLLGGLKEGGQLRHNLDTEAARVSLLSLMAFPFVGAPILKQAFGFDVREQDTAQWVQHCASLFLHGSAETGKIKKDDCE